MNISLKGVHRTGVREGVLREVSELHAPSCVPLEPNCEQQLERVQKFNDDASVRTMGDSIIFMVPQRKKPQPWSQEDSELFFMCLEVYGEELELFRTQLGHKSLRQIQRKFHKELKKDPARVNAALSKAQELTAPSSRVDCFDSIFRHSSEEEDDLSLDELVDRKLERINIEAKSSTREVPSFKELMEKYSM